ncbi:lipase/thioesterase family protein [Aspergillus eucalypticola CBS 122712]|uniref:Lipase/thioesterase family protein n=1 Tax=Aspergillus eucalypticola (strain CBS 122712 / IBT 29274) TaxID=1448314 RepID=A0A317VC23_ASPEC|nr:lipase/thioesterase family protein [Aspergillus eucalypticola CBS 122712]PWY69450.1 lipase/thioesterase family protein [Aspergillus eucalypticola CBS 122712]
MITPKISLSLAEKLDLVPALASITLTVFWALLTSLWRSAAYPKTLVLHIGYAAFRKATARMTVAQMQYALPTTDQNYERYVRKHKLPSNTVDLGDGALGHWIGDPKADNILIWYHGIFIPSFPFHRPFPTTSHSQNKYRRRLRPPRQQRLLSVLLEPYNSSAELSQQIALHLHTNLHSRPGGTYPTQLRQATSALRHILTTHSPSQILLGGDSAGGNLVGGVLSHLAHPHPQIAPITCEESLRGAIMIAPWTSLASDYTDQEIDSRGDLITPAVAGPWAQAYLGSGERDHYTDLSSAPAEWFESFPVEKVLVCGGGREILLPVIEGFVGKLREGFKGEMEFCVGEGEGHVAPIYNLYIGEKEETGQGMRVRGWLGETL